MHTAIVAMMHPNAEVLYGHCTYMLPVATHTQAWVLGGGD